LSPERTLLSRCRRVQIAQNTCWLLGYIARTPQTPRVYYTPLTAPAHTINQPRPGTSDKQVPPAARVRRGRATRDFLGDQFLDLPLHDVIGLTRAVADVSVCISTKKTTTTNSETQQANKPNKPSEGRTERDHGAAAKQHPQANQTPNTLAAHSHSRHSHSRHTHTHFIQTLQRIHTRCQCCGTLFRCSLAHTHTHTLAQLPASTSNNNTQRSLLCVLVTAAEQIPPHSPCKDDSPDR
jgi:hypothetical protein